ncbi:acyltransferase [Campylobacter sp. RM15925]|uniref:acyltransferase family protein n=1 Tax=Campylobacter sp. RM15925 TaxID=1705724 RepID=UPI001475B739|nr:acyltransferase [Campylobacter sp. RM15925]
MFGYIRFILAYMVLLSHMNYKFLGYNIGVFAVVFFYILAGLVTSKVFIKIAPKDSQISYFIKDRFLRIYPTYLFALLITILFFCATKYLEPNFSFKNLFYHLSIIPLNYFFWLDVQVFNAPIGLNFLIPPAWSLGAELQAYCLLVIAIKFKRLGFMLAFISFIVFCVANLGYINSDIYGYRTVCGVFFIFYTGFLIYQRKYKTLALFYIGIILLFTFLIYKNRFGIFSIEIIIGYLLGVLLVLTHEKFKFKLKFNEILGSLSYSLFISHFLFIWISEYVFNIQNLYFITLGSIVFGLINYYLLENRVNKTRFHNR